VPKRGGKLGGQKKDHVIAADEWGLGMGPEELTHKGRDAPEEGERGKVEWAGSTVRGADRVLTPQTAAAGKKAGGKLAGPGRAQKRAAELRLKEEFAVNLARKTLAAKWAGHEGEGRGSGGAPRGVYGRRLLHGQPSAGKKAASLGHLPRES